MTIKRDIGRFVKKMNKIINAKDENMKKVGEESIRIIQSRTRRGKGVDKVEGTSKPLKGLADSTKKARKKAKKRGELHPLTRPTKSALTLTGDMLDNMRVFLAKKGRAVIGVARRDRAKSTGHHKGSGRLPKRPFLNLAKAEIRQVRLFYRRLVGDLVRKANR